MIWIALDHDALRHRRGACPLHDRHPLLIRTWYAMVGSETRRLILPNARASSRMAEEETEDARNVPGKYVVSHAEQPAFIMGETGEGVTYAE
jgi:hypothetical protein